MRQHCCHRAAAWCRGRPQACWLTAMDSELGARGRAAQPPARYAGCHGARRREHLLAPSTPGCRSPPSPVTAQAGPRAAATTERSASGREARQSFATTARSGGSTALTWRHTWTRALRMCSVTRPSVGRGVNFGCTVKGHGAMRGVKLRVPGRSPGFWGRCGGALRDCI